jgi:hypothetical protein
MPPSNQTHIFATKQDLEPGLRKLESDCAVKYARLGLYSGPNFEQHISLTQWDGLGRNDTGDHISGPAFLVVPRHCEIALESVSQATSEQETPSDTIFNTIFVVDSLRRHFLNHLSLYGQFLDEVERSSTKKIEKCDVRFSLGQESNPESIVFQPGGLFDGERFLVCGHVGTISRTPVALRLYKSFVKSVTDGFQRIGSYRVGPAALRLMNSGCRMVTIGVHSPSEYDLKR